MQRKVYILENLDCANCAAKIERKLSKLPELNDVSVTFATKQLRFEAEDPEAVLPKIRETIQSMEPDVEVVERTRGKRKTAEHHHEHHEHGHEEGCGCGHDHHHEHHDHEHGHEESCGCGHEHHHDHGHEDGCGCGHDHHHEPSKPQATRSHTHFEVEFHHVAGHPDHCDCSQCNSYVEYCDVCGESLAKCTCHMPDEDLEKKVYILEGIDCANCAAKIEAKIRQMPEVRDVPVIMVTAKGAEFDKVKGLDLGADDYITKPFGMMEFISRVKAVLRRGGSRTEETLVHGPIQIRIQRHEVLVHGQKVELTLKEFELLKYLVENRGIVLTRDQLLTRIWGYDFDGETRTVDVHVRTLRQKLGEAGACIETVRGVGYRMGDEA